MMIEIHGGTRDENYFIKALMRETTGMIFFGMIFFLFFGTPVHILFLQTLSTELENVIKTAGNGKIIQERNVIFQIYFFQLANILKETFLLLHFFT